MLGKHYLWFPRQLFLKYVIIYLILKSALGASSTLCGQASENIFTQLENNEAVNVPWTATITITTGKNGARHEAGIIVSPTIVMTEVGIGEKNFALEIYPFEDYYITVGAPFRGKGEMRLLISHISVHPKYFNPCWATFRFRNSQILFHLQQPLNISESVQPICLPESLDKMKELEMNNNLVLTGWKSVTDYEQQLFMKLLTVPVKECERRWTNQKLKSSCTFVYKDIFCADMVGGNYDNRCIDQPVGPVKLMQGAYHLAGQFNIFLSYNKTCTPYETLYFFNALTWDTVNWIRSSTRCGSSHFTCGDGTCIPVSKLCNRIIDCQDGDDEQHIFCENLYKCEQDQFHCSLDTGTKCISKLKVKDGVNDCDSGEDEKEESGNSSDAEMWFLFVGVVAAVIIVSSVAALIVYIYYKNKHAADNLSPTTPKTMTDGGSISMETIFKGSSSVGLGTPSSRNNSTETPWKTNSLLISLGQIGQGAFGRVYRAKDLSDIHNPSGYAIKCINIRKMGNPDASDFENLLKEIDILNNLNCDNIVRYYGCWAEAEDSSDDQLTKSCLQRYVQWQFTRDFTSTSTPVSFVYIKLEYCDFALKEWIQLRFINSVEEKEIVGIVSGVIKGLNYVHTKGYIHRDIKPENILCKVESTDVNIWKIGDFGLAVENSVGGNVGQAGTRSYRSPEMNEGFSYTTKTDVYSLGIVFLEMISEGQSPLDVYTVAERLMELGDKKKMDYISELSKGKHDRIANVVKQMLKSDPNDRFTSQNVLYELTSDCSD